MSIDLIRAKQKELAAAKAAAEQAAADRARLAREAFAATGIPEMWEAIRDTIVPTWRGNGSRENDNAELVSLHAHVKKQTDTHLQLRDWDDEVKVGWGVEVTDKGAVWYIRRGRGNEAPKSMLSAEALRDDFVEYMAKFLPPLENAT